MGFLEINLPTSFSSRVQMVPDKPEYIEVLWKTTDGAAELENKSCKHFIQVDGTKTHNKNQKKTSASATNSSRKGVLDYLHNLAYCVESRYLCVSELATDAYVISQISEHNTNGRYT